MNNTEANPQCLIYLNSTDISTYITIGIVGMNFILSMVKGYLGYVKENKKEVVKESVKESVKNIENNI